MQPFLTDGITEYLSHLRLAASSHQFDAASQALHHFTTALSACHNVPVSKLTVTHAGAGGFRYFVDYLQSNLSVESEHLYSRAVLDFLVYLRNRLQPDLPTDDLAAYLTANRRTKSHEIQPPPLRILAKIAATASRTPLPPDPDSERDTLRFLRDKAFILTLAETGAKLSTLCKMRVRQFHARLAIPDDETSPLRYVAATRAYLRQRTTLDSSQTLPSADLPVFARHDKRAADQVLPISRWTGANIINSWLDLTLNTEDYDMLQLNNYTITSQSFRDAYIITMLHQSDDVQSVMESAGHADETTTRRYLSLVEQLKDDLEALA